MEDRLRPGPLSSLAPCGEPGPERRGQSPGYVLAVARGLLVTSRPGGGPCAEARAGPAGSGGPARRCLAFPQGAGARIAVGHGVVTAATTAVGTSPVTATALTTDSHSPQ